MRKPDHSEDALDRDEIDLLIPGGVINGRDRLTLVSDLLTLAGDAPEVDIEATVDIMQRAARVVFTDGLLLKAFAEQHTEEGGGDGRR